MLTENDKVTLHESLRDANPTYSGATLTGTSIYRRNDKFSAEESYGVISFLPGGKKVKSVSTFAGFRDNPLYKNYEYLENETCVITIFSEDKNGIRGRILADEWLRQLETYIKNNWSNLINKGSIDRDSFTSYKEVPEMFTEKMYGLQTQFDIWTRNSWTDQPTSGYIDAGSIDYIYVTEAPLTGTATGKVELWIE